VLQAFLELFAACVRHIPEAVLDDPDKLGPLGGRVFNLPSTLKLAVEQMQSSHVGMSAAADDLVVAVCTSYEFTLSSLQLPLGVHERDQVRS
jgi:hypothetical protein